MAFETVGVKITLEGVAAFERGMGRVERSTDKAGKEIAKMEKRSKAFNRAMKLMGLALVAAGSAAVAFLFRATKLAARVETLGVVTVQLGKNIGKTEKEIRALEKAIQDQGITIRGSRAAVALMIQSQIDLAKGTELARLAQNAAVIANVNSTEAFQRLVFVITSGNVKMARTLGLQVNFQQAYKKSAAQLGKTSVELTELEKIQARTNAVLETGTTIAGAYAAAMETAGKKVLSLDREVEDSLVILGESFLPLYGQAIDKVTEFLQAFQDASSAQQTGVAATLATTAAMSGYVGALILARTAVIALIAQVKLLGIATVASTAGILAVVAALASLVVISQKVKAENKELRVSFLEAFKATVLANEGYEQYLERAMEAAQGTQLMVNALRLSEKTGRSLEEAFVLLAGQYGLFDEKQVEFTRNALKASGAFLDTGDAARKSGAGIIMSADAYVILQQRLKEMGVEQDITGDKTKELALETQRLNKQFQAIKQLASVDLTQAFTDYQGKVEDLTGTISALEDKRYLTPAQREDLEDARAELEETNKAWRKHTSVVILSLFEQAIALDGFTKEELLAFATLQEELGLVDKGYVSLMEAVFGVAESDIGVDEKVEDLLELHGSLLADTTAAEDLDRAIQNIRNKQIRVETVFVQGQMPGPIGFPFIGAPEEIPIVIVPPDVMPPKFGPKQAGGFVQRGRAHLIGERGPEIFAPGMSGMVLPNAFVKAVSTVTALLRGMAPALAGAPVTNIAGSSQMTNNFNMTVNTQAPVEPIIGDFRSLQALANAV